MAGIAGLSSIYNPLAKVEKPQDMVCTPAGETTTSCAGQGGQEAAEPLPRTCPLPGITRIIFETLPLRSWRDSETVSALRAFLKSPEADGISLVVGNDGFVLKFRNGINPDRDPERWQTAVKAEGLLSAAAADLAELQHLGLLKESKA